MMRWGRASGLQRTRRTTLAGHQLSVPMEALLGSSLLSLMVDPNKTKTLVESVSPLEIVEKASNEVAVDRNSGLHGRHNGVNMTLEIVDPALISDDAIIARTFGVARTVFGHND